MLKYLFLVSAVLLTGCAQDEPFKNSASIDEIYGAVHGTAERETVSILRQGLRSRQELGSSDPYYPIRQPDVVAPVWIVPDSDDASGVKHGGRWDYIVVEEAEWAN